LCTPALQHIYIYICNDDVGGGGTRLLNVLMKLFRLRRAFPNIEAEVSFHTHFERPYAESDTNYTKPQL
jgi:hypothetical protein